MSIAQRGRGISVIGFVLAGGIGIISSTQTWLAVTRADAGEAILIPGADALPLLAPLSLAVLALGGALAIVGRVLRYLLAGIGLLAALALVWWSAEVWVSPPISAVSPTVTEVTGLAGTETITGVVQEITPTFWPVLALFGWVILVLAAVFAFVTAGRWRRGGRRFRTEHAATDGPVDAIDSWDDLSRGTDPTR